MCLCDIPDVNPGVCAGDNIFVALAIIVDHFEPFVSRGIEILFLLNGVNHRLDITRSESASQCFITGNRKTYPENLYESFQ